MSLLPAGSQLVMTSRLLPPVVVDLSGGPQPLPTVAGAIGTTAFLKLLAPTFSVNVAGQTIGPFSPAGMATRNYWPQIKIGLLVSVGLGLFWIVRKVL